MFYLGIFVGLWFAMIIYGLSHDAKRWWHQRRLDRAFAEMRAREQAANDLRESLRGMCH